MFWKQTVIDNPSYKFKRTLEGQLKKKKKIKAQLDLPIIMKLIKLYVVFFFQLGFPRDGVRIQPSIINYCNQFN